MSQISRPFQGTTIGDSGNYSAQQWRDVWLQMINGAIDDNSGVLAKSNSGGQAQGLVVSQTSPASKSVEISLGAAFVQGAYYELYDTVETLTISDNNDADDRIDLVVLRLSTVLQTVRLAVLEGTPDPSPVAPTLTQTSTVWEIPLAQIDVASLFSTIVDADIDISVRSYANVQYPVEGGTGLQSLAIGDVLGATSTNVIEAVNLADYQSIVRDDGGASEFGRATPVKSVALYEEPSGTNGAAVGTATWTTVPFNSLIDNAGIFSSMVAGVFTIAEDGTYLMSDFKSAMYNTAGAGGVREYYFRLYNITTATTYSTGAVCALSAGGSFLYGIRASMLESTEFTASAGDTIAVQCFEDSGSFLFGLARSWTVNSISPDERYNGVTFRRVK